MRLIQIHHQFPDGRTVFVRQTEVRRMLELLPIVDALKKSHPLPKGANWLFCAEGAPEWMYTRAEHQ